MISIRLPIPPSVNSMYSSGKKKGRLFKSEKYKAWEIVADKELQTQWRHLRQFIPITGKPIIVLKVNDKQRGDVSNRCKAAEDFLVSRGLTLDDRHNWSVTATKDPAVPLGYCIVEITRADAA